MQTDADEKIVGSHCLVSGSSAVQYSEIESVSMWKFICSDSIHICHFFA